MYRPEPMIKRKSWVLPNGRSLFGASLVDQLGEASVSISAWRLDGRCSGARVALDVREHEAHDA